MIDAKTKKAAELLWHPPTLSHFQPVETRNAAAHIGKRWAALTPNPPDPMELGDLFENIKLHWTRQGSMEGLPARTARWVPWVLFYPPAEKGSWIGADNAVVSKYGKWVQGSGGLRTRLTASTICVLLREYPTQVETFAEWLALTRELLRGTKHARLDAWRVRQKAFGILNIDGPKRVARAFLESDVAFEQLAEDLGLDNAVRASAFLEACVREGLVAAATVLRDATEERDLQRLFSLIEADGKRLRFESLSSAVADALLLPWAAKPPKPKVQGAIQTFLLRHLGDPRIRPAARWFGTNEAALAVVRRWLVGATLDDFFRIIRDTAYERQWEYREAFWWAYLTSGLIDDAWVAFGLDANREGLQVFDRKSLPYGRLNSGQGVQGDQSVLLLRIGHLIIAEGSHNWTCRVWHFGDKTAPDLYMRQYARHHLASGARFEKRHMGSETGRWQADLADYIARETGHRVARSEYMPR